MKEFPYAFRLDSLQILPFSFICFSLPVFPEFSENDLQIQYPFNSEVLQCVFPKTKGSFT